MANMDYWTPHLESKLHCWHQMQVLTMPKRPDSCLTIAREFGCQAYPLAERLLEKLNADHKELPWIIVGNQVLAEVAKLSGYSVAQIEKTQDTPTTVKAIFSMFLDRHLAEETAVFQHLKPVIREYANRGHCIFIGHGAALATQDLANCIHLRLVAPHDFRVKQIMARHKISAAEAEDYIASHQQQRNDFLFRFAASDINDPQNYHLVLNNGRMSIDAMAEVAMSYLH